MTRLHFLLCGLLVCLIAACGDDDSTPMGTPCTTSAECPATRVCVDGFCAPAPDSGMDTGAGDTNMAMLMCMDGRDPCGRGPAAVCCGEGDMCAGEVCIEDCGANPRCAGACCSDGQECLVDRCVIECDETQRCGDDGDLCCDGATEACFGGSCVELGEECALTEECELEEICEPTLGRCLPRGSIDVCEFRPPVGEFNPVTACRFEAHGSSHSRNGPGSS